ncbi:MAG: metallophosphatase family protein [Actinobacteria bacterium]|nr:metallophosphatase family protein [Actinomycetota bacterium]
MRIAVVSDIHGNVHALQAVLAAIEEDAVDEIWCLGDLVGYGPDPNACCTLVAERTMLSLIGNHDLAVLGRLDIEEFSPDAAASARWTQQELDSGSRAFLETLEPTATRGELGLFHGSPRDPVWEYVLSAEVALAALADAEERIVLVGHSHVALALALRAATIEGGVAPAEREVGLDDADRWLFNPGSVGQPRDGDPRAAYLVLDLGERRAIFRRVPYAVAETQAAIRAAGLPEPLAARLEHGV